MYFELKKYSQKEVWGLHAGYCQTLSHHCPVWNVHCPVTRCGQNLILHQEIYKHIDTHYHLIWTLSLLLSLLVNRALKSKTFVGRLIQNSTSHAITSIEQDYCGVCRLAQVRQSTQRVQTYPSALLGFLLLFLGRGTGREMGLDSALLISSLWSIWISSSSSSSSSSSESSSS